jgi:hypothetical protein
MRLVPLLVAVAACALAAVTTIAYVTKPAEVRVQYRAKATAARPTLAQFKRLVAPIKTTSTAYTTRPDTGGTVYCARTDSTFSPTETSGITWQAQWCWNVPRAEAEANGLLKR